MRLYKCFKNRIGETAITISGHLLTNLTKSFLTDYLVCNLYTLCLCHLAESCCEEHIVYDGLEARASCLQVAAAFEGEVIDREKLGSCDDRHLMLGEYVMTFELAATLLLAALVGAIVLAKEEGQ